MSQEQIFWEWFAAHAPEYRNISSNPEQDELFDEFLDHLRAVDPRLGFEFGPEGAGEQELIFSAQGDADVFPVIEGLVDSAPDIPEWQVSAFRSRQGSHTVVSSERVGLRTDNLQFSLNAEGDRIGVNLYFAGVELNSNTVTAAFALLDAVLGEYDAATKIGSVECRQVGEAADPAELQPFEKLPEVFDEFYRALHPA